MKEAYEDAYARIEADHPWFVARRDLFADRVRDDQGARIVDIGCGTGMFLSHLHALGFARLAGVEVSARLRARFRVPSIPLHETIPTDRTFDVVFMLDVLEHIADDVGTLDRVHDALEPGGRFLLSVPAHPFLWGPHDDVNQHERRYRKRELRDKLTAAGFAIERLSYWNLFAFPAVCAVRWLGLGKGDGAGDLGLGPSLALRVYSRLLALENRLLRRMTLPFGVSLVAFTRRVG